MSFRVVIGINPAQHVGSAVIPDATLTSAGVMSPTQVAALAGGFAYRKLTAGNTPYAVAPGDCILGINGAGGFTVDLPQASAFGAGRLLIIKDEAGNAATSNIIIHVAAGDTSETSGISPLNLNSEVVGIYSDGVSHWFIWTLVANH